MGRTGRRVALRKPFYGWWIVLASLLFHGLSGAAFGFTFGQYLLRIEDDFGWSNFAISGTYSASLFSRASSARRTAGCSTTSARAR